MNEGTLHEDETTYFRLSLSLEIYPDIGCLLNESTVNLHKKYKKKKNHGNVL